MGSIPIHTGPAVRRLCDIRQTAAAAMTQPTRPDRQTQSCPNGSLLNIAWAQRRRSAHKNASCVGKRQYFNLVFFFFFLIATSYANCFNLKLPLPYLQACIGQNLALHDVPADSYRVSTYPVSAFPAHSTFIPLKFLQSSTVECALTCESDCLLLVRVRLFRPPRWPCG